MTKSKDKELVQPKKLGLSNAVKRTLRTDLGKLAETVAEDVLKERERARKRIQDARQEIEDGARPRKGRFHL